jgi:hypothetical protein
MKQIFFRLFLLSFGLPVFLHAQNDKYTKTNLGFTYPISTNGKLAGEYTNKYSFNALVGLSKNEKSFALNGVAGIIKDSASGLQIAGFSNTILNQSDGIQIAGFMNYVKNKAGRLQIAGFTNINGTFEGMQFAGFTNINDSSDGLQLAGFANISKKTKTGSQLSGFFNTGGNIEIQIAGFFNKAAKVRGVQIAGFMNIADSSDYPIGFLNIIKYGERSISLTMDETLTSLVSYRSGSRHLYGILGAGYNWKKNQSLYAFEAGLGAHLILTVNFRLNTEIALLWLTKFESGEYLRSSFRLLPSLKLGSRIEIFGGPSFNYVHSTENTGINLVSHYLWSETKTDYFQGLYFGVLGGIQINL